MERKGISGVRWELLFYIGTKEGLTYRPHWSRVLKEERTAVWIAGSKPSRTENLKVSGTGEYLACCRNN